MGVEDTDLFLCRLLSVASTARQEVDAVSHDSACRPAIRALYHHLLADAPPPLCETLRGSTKSYSGERRYQPVRVVRGEKGGDRRLFPACLRNALLMSIHEQVVLPKVRHAHMTAEHRS